MKTINELGLLGCIMGLALGTGVTWAPTTARADLSTEPSAAGRDCGYNNLFCEPGGSLTCIMCGSGSDVTCYEDRNRCPDLTT